MHQTEAMFDAAVMLMRAGRRAEAADLAWQVSRKDGKHADAWAMLAHIETAEGRIRNAIIYRQLAVNAAPKRHDIWNDLGIDTMTARMHKEAEDCFKRSLALTDTFEGHFNYANLLASTMRVDEAIEQYGRALEINPTHAQAATNLGTALIGAGRWREGFEMYRARVNSPGFPPAPRINWPQWKGEPLDGKTILLFVEQGFGDEIMSLRFAAHVKDVGARVILSVRPPVFRLARSFPQADAVIMQYDASPWQPDYQCALLDVPAYVDIEPHSVPYKRGYLRADDRGFRLGFPAGLNVGICWASGKRDLQPGVAETARQKTLAFGQLAPLLARPGINLVSLQQSHADGLALRDLGVLDPMAGVTDFADTAWIIDHLDLVVTVDTSVAHLAGALGKPVFNLVRFDALWPWMQEDGPTCWYDAMTVYRQERPFDWSAPLKRLKADFDAFVAQRQAEAEAA